MLHRFLNRLQTRAAPAEGERSSVQLELRRLREGVVIGRASNDTIVDSFGTVITVEALHDWWQGYQQHRTVNLQHNLPELRGIRGRPAVGIGRRVDFTPQLEVEIKVLDPQVDQLIEQHKIRGLSLEFFATQQRIEQRAGRNAKVYYRLATEPELCSLSLVDVPGVPQSDILEIRGLQPFWSYAVVDPKVLNGEVTDPQLVSRLMWFPHHDTESPLRSVDERALKTTLANLDPVDVPAEASLSREQIIQRAREHLDRHVRLGLGMRASQKEEKTVNKWIQLRAQQYQAEGLSEADATAKAEADYQALTPEVRAKIEGDGKPAGTPEKRAEPTSDEDKPGLFQRLFGGGNNVTINTAGQAAGESVQTRAKADGEGQGEEKPKDDPAKVKPKDDPAKVKSQEWLEARAALHQVEGLDEKAALAKAREELTPEKRAELDGEPADLEGRVSRMIQENPAIRAMLAQPENPMAAMTGGARARQRMDSDELLGEIMTRTVVPQLERRALDTNEVQKAYNMLRAHGISERALTIEANGTVIREDLARQFVVKPAADIVFRNHMRSLPMQGQKKVDFPRFSRQGLTFQWNRSSAAGAGSTAAITASDPTLDTFPIEVTELNGAAVVPDSFLNFNASGTAFVQQYLLPELRGAAQYEEDRAFFLGDGAAPDPATFTGFHDVTGVTAVTPSTDGDAFTEDILGSLMRALPAAFRSNPSRLAFYIPTALGDDLLDIRAARVTALGDRVTESDANVPGPMPIARYRSVNVYAVPQLPTDEVQGGSAAEAATIYLVHRDQPVIGDALTIRMEPFRQEGFVTKLQLQEFVGLGYQFPSALVRRAGVLPKA